LACFGCVRPGTRETLFFNLWRVLPFNDRGIGAGGG
jgi:hypothetical protein